MPSIVSAFKVSEISEIIDKNEDKLSYYSSVSKGLAGLVWFKYYQFLFFKENKYLDQLDEILVKAINHLNSDEYPQYFVYRDIGEIGKLLLFLIRRKVIELEDVEELLINFDNILYTYMQSCIKDENFDAVAGANLAGFYFIERLDGCNGNKELISYLEELIEALIKNGIQNKDRLHWIFNFNFKKETPLGRSHGICNMIHLLSKLTDLSEFSLKKPKLDEMISHAVNYLMDAQLKMEGNESLFPHIAGSPAGSIGNTVYGDLGIGFTLKEVAAKFNKPELNETANLIFERFFNISIADNENINDANMIYGTSGIAAVFKRLHLTYGDELYEKCYKKYIQYTMDYATHDNDLAGYKIYWNTSDEWTNYCFTQGLIGIGLTLIGCQIDDVDYLSLLNY